jgi:ribosomal protein S18 acetylase RimI-like enzyme
LLKSKKAKLKSGMLEIRKAVKADQDEVWKIIQTVIATGDTYVFAPDSPKEKMLDYWFGEEKETYVAVWSETQQIREELENEDLFILHPSSFIPQILGTFFLKANQPDLGSHICNAGYMVSPEAKGQGIGRRMAEFSLPEAKRLGFQAMQFNFVVKSNEVAVKLWLSLGFEIIGEIPAAFQHAQNGLTNALIMHRKL